MNRPSLEAMKAIPAATSSGAPILPSSWRSYIARRAATNGDGSRPAAGFLSFRCRRILAKQAHVFELGPEVIGDRHVEPPQVLLELGYSPDSEEDRANLRSGKGGL